MWTDIEKHAPRYKSAVLTFVDADGYPYSTRCLPNLERAAQVLRIELPRYLTVEFAPAGLLYHSHNERLWRIRDFLLRGALEKDARGWSFRPARFIPGVSGFGVRTSLRTYRKWRRATSRYLAARGLTRPPIPWREIVELKHGAKRKA